MNEIHPQYFLYSLATLSLACILASIFTSLRFTGDAGLPRLIEREGRQTKRLEFWKTRWPLLGKTTWLFLTLAAIATFIFFYLALQDSATWFMAGGIFFGGLVSAISARRIEFDIEKGGRCPIRLRMVLVLCGGVLVGFASRLAGGCTSGQALTGSALLLSGSFLFLVCLFAGGYAAAWFVRRQWDD